MVNRAIEQKRIYATMNRLKEMLANEPTTIGKFKELPTHIQEQYISENKKELRERFKKEVKK